MTPSTADAPVRVPMPMEPSGPCWICGAETRTLVWQEPLDLSNLPRFGPAHAHGQHPATRLVRCGSCGFGQPEAMPARTDYFATLYDIPYTDDDLAAMFDGDHHKDLINSTILNGLSRRLPAGAPRTLLDVGCHVGKFLQRASEAGWTAEGAELAARTAAYAAKRTGLPVHRVPARELAALGLRFSAVTLNDVLEHVPGPAPLVAELRGLLHRGGLLAIKVPHGPMQRLKERVRRDLLRRPDAGVMTRFVHVNHFTVKALRHCLKASGFVDVAIGVGAPECVPGAPEALMRLAAYRAARLLPGGVYSPLAMNLQAFATNPE